MKAPRPDVDLVVNTIEKIRPLLAGKPAEVQGAALADLLAMWLAGHIMPDDPEGTRELRETILAGHIDAVRELIPVNAKAMGLPE